VFNLNSNGLFNNVIFHIEIREKPAFVCMFDKSIKETIYNRDIGTRDYIFTVAN